MWIFGFKGFELTEFVLNVIGNTMFTVRSLITGFYLDFWMNVNNITNSIRFALVDKDVLYEIATQRNTSENVYNGFNNIVDAVRTHFSSNNIINAVVTISTSIAIVYLLVKLGFIIYKTYFLNIGNEVSTSLYDLFKRLVICLIIALIFPSFTFNLYYLGTLVGVGISNEITSEIQTDDEIIQKDIMLQYYVFNKKYGLRASTFCDDSEYEARDEEKKVTTDSGPYGSNYSDEYNKVPKLPNILKYTEEENDDKEMWNTFCEPALSNPYNQDFSEMEVDQKVFHTTSPEEWGSNEIFKWNGTYPARVGQTLIDKINPDYLIWSIDGRVNLKVLFNFIIQLVFSFWVWQNVANGIAGLLATTLMSWYYIQAYFEPENNGALGHLIKKVLKLSFSQMFTLIFFGIFITYSSLNTGFSLTELIIKYILLMIIIGGTSTIHEMFDLSDLRQGHLGSVTSKGIKTILR